MKIALLHYSTWPEIGGVENVICDQANILFSAGHDVKIITGVGADREEGCEFVLMPELAPDFELNKSVRTVLERGQSDQNFNKYRAILVEALKTALAGVDLTIVHNVFTLHHNLVLTRALHDLATTHRLVAWTHDLTATNSDFALPNPTQPPWNLMRTSAPLATYVATSKMRADEIEVKLKPPVKPLVIPNLVDPARIFGLSPEVRESLASLEIPWRDYIFLLPAPVVVRKNIDFALKIIEILTLQGRNALLLITAPQIAHSSAADHYSGFLRQSISEEMRSHVVFVTDFFEVRDEILRDLYLLSDCLLFPSRREGFGLPIAEAALHRMPVWCDNIPSFQELGTTGAFMINDINQLSSAISWLEAIPTFQQQRRCRRLFDPSVVYTKYYEPLLASFSPKKEK
jgi:glycosyltransferase involved in cell wall biosynthesis